MAQAAEQAVRPLVRFLIHWGVGYKDFCELLKRTYMEESAKSLTDDAKEVTASNLSLVSGIHRKDTSLFINQGQNTSSENPPRVKSSAAFSVFSRWISHVKYKNTRGQPLPLPYSSGKKEKSFTGLCTEITTDVRPKAIMQELLRLDLIAEQDENLHIKQDGYVPQKSLEEKLRFFASNIGQHIESAASNIIGHEELRFERMAHRGGLSAADIAELKFIASQKGMDLLKEIYGMAEERASNNDDTSDNDHEFSLGVFVNHSAKTPETDNKTAHRRPARKQT